MVRKDILNRITDHLSALNDIKHWELGPTNWSTEEGSELDELLTELWQSIDHAVDTIWEQVDAIEELNK